MAQPSREDLAISENLTRIAGSLFARGYSYGSAGNMSARVRNAIVATPTNSSFGHLETERLSLLDATGVHISGDKPTKEINFHLGIYRAVPAAGAIVHLHSTYATAFSCLNDLPDADPLPYFTPYFPMRVARMPVVPYYPPGSLELAASVEAVAADGPVILLRNHGSIAWGADLSTAAALAEELEEQCKLWFLLEGRGRALSNAELAALHARFGTPGA
ncbi:MAG: aldolase [Bryobacterales bacterium]|nr:aldolase [Bryobacterales bacterium]